MSIEQNLFDFIYQNSLKEEFDRVRKSLLEFHNDFYERILAVPGMKTLDLPLISQTSEGPLIIQTSDGKFSSSICYYFYPWLFSDAFPEIDKKDLDVLCEIAQLYAESLIEFDKVIDNQLQYPEIMQTVTMISSQYKLSITIRKLAQLFDSTNPFWKRFDQLFSNYILQVLGEKTDISLKVPPLQEMERSAIDKVALAKIITAAMSELTGKKEILSKLEKSQDLFAVGYQLYDDVKDWRKDYRSGQYSYLLKKAFSEFCIVNETKDIKLPPTDDFGRHLFISDIIPDTLELAAVYLNRAEDVVIKINCSKWISWIELHKRNILNLRSDIIELRRREIDKAVEDCNVEAVKLDI